MFGRRKRNPGGRLDAEQFFIYYGLGTPSARDRLAGEPLLIVELRQWHPDDLRILRDKGSKIYGYLTVMESPSWHKTRIDRLNASDYFQVGGRPVRFEKWDSCLMDLRSSSYRRILFEELEEMHVKWPIDGLFLDTVGDIEEYVPESEKAGVTEAYRSLLAVMATRYPHTLRIQNRGFTQLQTCPDLLDGFLWEDWRSEWSKIPLFREQIDKLRKWNADRGLALLAVSPSPSKDDAECAREMGFLHRMIPPSYHELP